MNAYRAGNLAIINAPGNGVADDKGIYYFVPKMIRYYLGEEPILKNAPTYLPFYEEDREYCLANIERLVIKDVAEAGGYGVLFGKDLNQEELEAQGLRMNYLLISVANASRAAVGDCSLAMIRFTLLASLPVSVSSSF